MPEKIVPDTISMELMRQAREVYSGMNGVLSRARRGKSEARPTNVGKSRTDLW
jgi:hypothetical protein